LIRLERLREKNSQTFVQNLNGNFIPQPFTTNNILSGNLEVIKVQRARRAGADTELLLLLGDLDAHVFGCNETSDTLITLARVNLPKDNQGKESLADESGTRTLAKMRNTSASYEFVIHIFEPLMIQLSPSFVARVWRANASEPETGSDKQKLPS
jgi:hypothetical protein